VTTTAPTFAAPTVRVSARWIVSARYDLTFFIGAVVLTFAFAGLYAALTQLGLAPRGPATLVTYFVFTALFDLPHIFQTFSRTHADPIEFARRRRLYTWGVPIFMAAGLVVPFFGIEDLFLPFMALYGSHHIIRQHVGFLKIYQGLNDDRAPIDRFLDRAALEIGLYACVLSDYATTRGGWVHHERVYGTMRATLPSFPLSWLTPIGIVAWLALGAWVLRQLWLAASGRTLNLPKILLVLAALASHYFVFVIATVPFLVAETIETAYHDVQYHAWIANYQRKRFPGVRSVALKWIGVSLAYGVVAGVIECIGYANPRLYWLFAPLGMLTLFHYYVDGKIWKVSRCPELREVIRGPR
jgi:hypothetical protein